MRVQVYWNIAKNTWSVRDKTSGRVAKHLSSLVLDNCIFRVQAGGRARVLRECQKNIHAFVEGDLVAEGKVFDFNIYGCDGDEVTYNPYKHETFVKRNDNSPVFRAERAIFNSISPKVRICDPALAVKATKPNQV